MKKKLFSLLLVLLILSFSACGKKAETTPGQVTDTSEEQVVTSEKQSDSTKGLPDGFVAEASGVCGADLTWEYGNTILYIHGTGDMIDYHLDFRNGESIRAPWVAEYRDKIAKIIIEDGCTSIGNFAFAELPILVSIEIPSSVKRIGYGAFYWNDIGDDLNQMRSITIPEGVEIIEGKAFGSCPLESLEIPDSVTSMVENPLEPDNICNIKSLKMPKKLGYISIDTYIKSFNDTKGFDEIILPDDFDAVYEHYQYSNFSSSEWLRKVTDTATDELISDIKNGQTNIVWRGKTYSPQDAENLVNDLITAGIINSDYEDEILPEEHYRGDGSSEWMTE